MKGGKTLRCLRCGNEDDMYFHFDGNVWYCRKCIGFGRLNVGDMPKEKVYRKKKLACQYYLQYPLTNKQKIAVNKIMEYLAYGQDVLVYAACGAGKTELTMDAIQTYLRKGKKVGFAISRRQVVLEIRERMTKAFPMLEVIAVCEGYTSITDGDLIICTMHQLYRYPKTFDLLIMDEVDAFPYRDNAVLESIAYLSCCGQKLMLTATPDAKMLRQVEEGKLAMVTLFQRPHGYPLIIPKVVCMPFTMQIIYVLSYLRKQRKRGIQTLLFVPTIEMAQKLYLGLKWLFSCAVFTSKTLRKEEIVDAFHHKQYEFLISTTVLERGITIKGIYVVVLSGDHTVFHEASLIQMIGRVGRSIEMPKGEGVILCSRKTKSIKRCVKALEEMNKE